ncbi:helix-turn-helix transcriptional regulator [Candidatus Neomarinimicrobiota bacterium]
MNYYNMSDKALLNEIGRRVQRRRLNKNLTQNNVADLAGVSRNSVQALESGKGINLHAFVRILRTLDALDDLNALLPDPGLSPLQAAKMMGRTRQRASGSSGQNKGRHAEW